MKKYKDTIVSSKNHRHYTENKIFNEDNMVMENNKNMISFTVFEYISRNMLKIMGKRITVTKYLSKQYIEFHCNYKHSMNPLFSKIANK